MDNQARLITSDLYLPDETELQRVIRMGVESVGRRSVHPADRIAAIRVAAEVMRALQRANYIILHRPPAGGR
jgi:hypothetical protein